MLSQKTPTNNAELRRSPDRENATSSGSSRPAPNLLVIGAMKASTTTFYELITRHPDIWFSSEKEPHYFTSPQYGEPAAWQKYLDLFQAAPLTAKYIGEASTGYSKLPHFGNTPKRLQETLNQPRFIYLVRDPVERVISNFQHSYLSGHYAADTSLSEAINQDPILIDGSCYARQIRAYWDVFGKQSLLIISTDQLHTEPVSVMQQVELFLDLPAYEGWQQPLPQSNSKQALNSSLKLQTLLPRPLISVLRKLVPAKLRTQLKSLASSTPTLPPISDADRHLVFERVAADLNDLTTLADGDLLKWIATWPSVQKLGER